MAAVKPKAGKFLRWFPMQESSGNIVDVIGGDEGVETSATIGQGTGHVGANARDFERDDTGWFVIPDAAELRWYQSDLTLGYWFRAESFPTSGPYGYQVIKGDTSAGFGAFVRLEYGTGYKMRASIQLRLVKFTNTASISSAAWFFVMLSMDYDVGNTIEVYNASGTLVWNGTNTDTDDSDNNSGDLNIGGDPAGPGCYDGLMEQFFVYDGVFTTDEKTFMVNGGAGVQWSDIKVVGGSQFWYFGDWKKRLKDNLKKKLETPVPAYPLDVVKGGVLI